MAIQGAIFITGSVGQNGSNTMPDVFAVQQQLNDQMPPLRPKVSVTGTVDGPTIGAIHEFQQFVVGYAHSDGRIDPNGKTLKALNAAGSQALWMAHTLAGDIKKSNADYIEGWAECYRSSVVASSNFVPSGVKQWLSKPPAHRIEVGVFQVNHATGGSLVIWRSADEATVNQVEAGRTMLLQSYLEAPTDLDTIRRAHGLEPDIMSILGNHADAKSISALNDGWNKFMAYYVLNRGRSVSQAKLSTRRKLHAEGKAHMEINLAVVSGASGAKISRPTTRGPLGNPSPRGPQSNRAAEALDMFAQMPWGGYVQALDELFKAMFKSDWGVAEFYKTFKQQFEVVYAPDGAFLGWVRYLD